MYDVICGRGRLGSRAAAYCQRDGRPLLSLRIDRERGLVNPLGECPSELGCLLICLVPPHPAEGSGWSGLLDGLLAQVQRGELQLSRAVLVSSTAVYESHQHGWVDANSPVRPASARSAGLIEAEQRVRALSADHAILRLAGITGPGYERYDPIAMSTQQPRHAVDVRAAAELIHTVCTAAPSAARTELVTDGAIYYQQQSHSALLPSPVLQALAAEHRLMRPSLLARWPNTA